MKKQLLELTGPGWVVLVTALALSGVGVLCLIAAPPRLPAGAAIKQVAFLIAALGIGSAILFYGYQVAGRYSAALFCVSVGLLILMVVARLCGGLPLIQRTSDTYRWIQLGPINLQPSEVMKVCYIVALAWYLRQKANVQRLGGLIGPFILTVIPTMLVLLQPDLGTALLLLPVMFVMVFAAGARLRHLALIVLLAVLCLPMFWQRMAGYQRMRVAGLLLQYPGVREGVRTNPDAWAWLCPPNAAENWEHGSGYQLTSSLRALGNGGLSGQGWRNGVFVRHPFLPARHNDFIFAIIGEQWGLLGCVAVLAGYLIISVAGLEIALATPNAFGKLVAVGTVAMIDAQLLINIGMTIGLTPITGVTLPFVSYGGSSTVVTYMMLALLISVSQHRPWSLARKPFEYQEDDHGRAG